MTHHGRLRGSGPNGLDLGVVRLLAGAAMPEVDEVHVAVPGVMEIVPDGGDPMAIVRWTTACVMTSRASWGLLRRRQRWEKKCVVIGAPLMFKLQGIIGLGSMSVEWKGLGALGGRRAEADALSEHNIHYAQSNMASDQPLDLQNSS